MTASTTLHPGDVCCAEAGETLETLLGSCVAVVLTDRRRSIGAMCHIVHPTPPARQRDAGAAHAAPALARLFAMLRARAIEPRWCQAFVYGGGNMFPQHYAKRHVGERNTQVVLELLESAGVQVLHADTGGTHYRRLRWTVGPGLPTVSTGEVPA